MQFPEKDSNPVRVRSPPYAGYGAVPPPPVAPGSCRPGHPLQPPTSSMGVRSLPAACSGPWTGSQPQVLGRCLLAPWGWGAGRLTSAECFYCWTN